MTTAEQAPASNAPAAEKAAAVDAPVAETAAAAAAAAPTASNGTDDAAPAPAPAAATPNGTDAAAAPAATAPNDADAAAGSGIAGAAVTTKTTVTAETPPGNTAVSDPVACMPIRNLPYMKVYGGDVLAGTYGPVPRVVRIAPDGTIYYGSIGDFGYLKETPSGKIVTVSLKALLAKDEPVFNDVWQVESTMDGSHSPFLSRPAELAQLLHNTNV